MDLAETAAAAPTWWDTYGTWVTFFGGLVLGAGSSHWYSVWAKQPKLIMNGNSHGSDGAGRWRTSVSLTLAPSRLGGQVGQTTIFGRTLVQPFRWGLATAREPARECTVWLYAVDDRRQTAGLRWLDTKGFIVDGAVTIGPGETMNVALFGGETAQGEGGYYIMSGSERHAGSDRYRPIFGGAAQTQPRTFKLVVNQAYGPAFKRKISIYRDLSGSWVTNTHDRF